MKSEKIFVIGALPFFFFICVGAWGETPTPTPAAFPSAVSIQGDASKAPVDGFRVEPFPVVSYQSTYGALAGPGLKLAEPKTDSYLSASILTNLSNYTDYYVGLKWNRPHEWFFKVDASFGDNLTDYYGEGDKTPNVYQSLTSTLDQVHITFQTQLGPGITLGPTFQYLYRNWTNNSLFPDEFEWKMGVQASLDDRVPNSQPNQGHYIKLGIYSLPADPDDAIGTDVWQFEGEARYFQIILDPVVLVSRFHAGWTEGDPSYSFRYSLGGEWELRGYNSNRFRGNRFWVWQEEARFFFCPWLEGALSVDAGDITDTGFDSPLASFQVGLRTAPLPYLGVIARVDWGFGSDDNEIWLDTDEPF